MLGGEKLATFCMHSASGVRLIYRGWGGSSSLPPESVSEPHRGVWAAGASVLGGEWRTLHRWNFRGGEKNRLRFCIMYCSGQSATIKELIDFWRHPALQNITAIQQTLQYRTSSFSQFGLRHAHRLEIQKWQLTVKPGSFLCPKCSKTHLPAS